MFKVTNKNTRTMLWAFLLLTLNTFRFFFLFLGLPLNKQMLTGKMLRGQCWVMAVFDMFGNSMGVS